MIEACPKPFGGSWSRSGATMRKKWGDEFVLGITVDPWNVYCLRLLTDQWGHKTDELQEKQRSICDLKQSGTLNYHFRWGAYWWDQILTKRLGFLRCQSSHPLDSPVPVSPPSSPPQPLNFHKWNSDVKRVGNHCLSLSPKAESSKIWPRLSRWNIANDSKWLKMT